eukprot:gene6006-5293_t
MASVDSALRSPDIFPQAVIAQAIQQMEASIPLPPLFMRTVISALKSAPRLKAFVWLDKAQWRGFLMLVENSDKAFFPVMLQLPATVLDRCVNPPTPQDAGLKKAAALRLAQFAYSSENTVQVLGPSQAILDQVLAEVRREKEAKEAEEAALKAAEAAEEAALNEAEKEAATEAAVTAAYEGGGGLDFTDSRPPPPPRLPSAIASTAQHSNTILSVFLARGPRRSPDSHRPIVPGRPLIAMLRTLTLTLALLAQVRLWAGLGAWNACTDMWTSLTVFCEPLLKEGNQRSESWIKIDAPGRIAQIHIESQRSTPMALVSEGKAAAHTESQRSTPMALVSEGKAAATQRAEEVNHGTRK